MPKQTKPNRILFFSRNWTKFGMHKLAANSTLHAKFEANRRSFEVRGQNSRLLSFVNVIIVLWQQTEVSKTTKKNIAYLPATRGVYQ